MDAVLNNKINRLIKDVISLVNPGHGLTAATGDGTDETTVIQAMLTYVATHNLTLLIPAGYTFIVKKLYLDGYSNFSILGYGTLKRLDSSNEANTSILQLKNCVNVTIPVITTDGNVANNKAGGVLLNEMLHSVKLWLCTNVQIGVLRDTNPCGDSLYLHTSNFIMVDTLIGKSTDTTTGCGRNCLSVIVGHDIIIGKLLSYYIGWSSGDPATSMPGGIDIEPNLVSESLYNISIKKAYIYTVTSGFSIKNQDTILADVHDIDFDVEIYCTSEKTGSSNYVCYITNCINCHGRVRVKQVNTLKATAFMLSNCDGLDVDLYSYDSYYGLITAGSASGTINGIKNSRIKAKIDKSSVSGVWLKYIQSDVDYDLAVKDHDSANTSGTSIYCMVLDSTAVLTNITFTGDIGKKNTGTRCIKGGGSTLTKVRLRHLNMSGYASRDRLILGVPTSGFLDAYDCIGYTDAASEPLDTAYAAGQKIKNTAPTAGGYAEWICTATGVKTTAAAINRSTAYSKWTLRTAGGFLYVCYTAGTTSGTEPTWTSANTTDGTVTWQCIGATTGVLKGCNAIAV